MKRSDFGDADIKLQFECMVEAALMKNFEKLSGLPPVVVLDALDECGSDNSQLAQCCILLDTITSWSHLPSLFKLIVTSQDEHVLSSFYNSKYCCRIVLETGDSVNHKTTNNICIFSQSSFAHITPEIGLPTVWPGETTVEKLTEQ